VEQSIEELQRSWGETLTSERGSIEAEFQRLTEEWKADTEFLSSPTRIAVHPAYQRIIGMGLAAVPMILRDLAATHAPWFWALRAITGEDPIPAEDRGYLDRMVRHWVRWGVRKNML
jgi:hypothetical protein